MKKLLIIILCFITVFSLFGCASEKPLTEEEMNDLLAGNVDKEPVDDADLTILLCGPTTYDVEVAIHDYEILHGIKINVKKYKDGQWDKFATKILSQDDDFDLFLPVNAQLASLIRAKGYQDLNDYENIKSRLEGNNLTKMLADIEGELIGLPCNVYLSYTGDNNTAYTFFKYGYKNINLFTNEYSDPDGEELFEVLRHLYNNQEDTKIDPYYDFEYHYSVTSYLFMNKYSVNKDVAADFMCYMFDALNKDIESAVHMTYPVPDEGAEYTPYWLYWSNDLVEPLTSAKDELMISDGSDEAIRKLAEDAARGLRMRLEG